MGVFDTAWIKCPNCKENIEQQISQVSNKYCMTDWYLYDYEDLARRLNADELKRLKFIMEDEEFWCHKCHTGPHYFNSNHKNSTDSRLALAKELFGGDE